MTDPAASERLAYQRLLSTEGLGASALRRLIDRFGAAERVFAADAESIAKAGKIDADVVRRLKSPASLAAAQVHDERMRAIGARLLLSSDEEYPRLLREIGGAPPALTVRGGLVPADRFAIAIVGSRRCTPYGERIAGRLARELASRGFAVVSGLARGIDAAAHLGALDAGGRTVAVLASGLANLYPPEHARLADRVCESGAILSEAPLDGPPLGKLFPQRNRIISGISLGVVVVEAAQRSGALSTARHALEQGRDVFAVPGRVGDAASEGTNQLIKEGAFLVRSAEDVIEQLGPIELPEPIVVPAAAGATADPPGMEKGPPPPADGAEKRLWEALANDDLSLEVLLERTGLAVAEASAALLLLEMRRLVRRLPGNRYVRV